jgi:hypothetical protein
LWIIFFFHFLYIFVCRSLNWSWSLLTCCESYVQLVVRVMYIIGLFILVVLPHVYLCICCNKNLYFWSRLFLFILFISAIAQFIEFNDFINVMGLSLLQMVSIPWLYLCFSFPFSFIFLTFWCPHRIFVIWSIQFRSTFNWLDSKSLLFMHQNISYFKVAVLVIETKWINISIWSYVKPSP